MYRGEGHGQVKGCAENRGLFDLKLKIVRIGQFLEIPMQTGMQMDAEH